MPGKVPLEEIYGFPEKEAVVSKSNSVLLRTYDYVKEIHSRNKN